MLIDDGVPGRGHRFSLLRSDGSRQREVPVPAGVDPERPLEKGRLAFDDSGETLFVVTEDGVSVVELGALPLDSRYRAPLVGFASFDPVVDTEITPDGTHAVTRVAGQAEVRMLVLAEIGRAHV